MKFHQGDQHRYKTTVDLTVESKIGADTPIIKLHSDSVYLQTVKSVDAATGNATLTVQLLSMAQTVNGQPSPIPAEISKSLEQPDQVVVTPALTLVSTDLTAMQQAQIEQALGTNPILGIEGYDALPLDPVTLGQNWQSSFHVPIGLNANVKAKLKSVDSGANGQVAATDVTLGGDLATLSKSSNAPVKFFGTITGKGNIAYGLDQGVVSDVNVTMDIDATVVPKLARGQTVPKGQPSQAKVTMDMTIAQSLDDSDTTPIPTPDVSAAPAPAPTPAPTAPTPTTSPAPVGGAAPDKNLPPPPPHL
jgi:hypothetical protein